MARKSKINNAVIHFIRQSGALSFRILFTPLRISNAHGNCCLFTHLRP